MRWNDPAYRKKVIRKREARPDEDDTVSMVETASPVQIERPLPQLHDLLRSDAVAWSTESGGWAGAGEGLNELPSPRIGSFVRGRTGKPGEGGSPGAGEKGTRTAWIGRSKWKLDGCWFYLECEVRKTGDQGEEERTVGAEVEPVALLAQEVGLGRGR